MPTYIASNQAAVFVTVAGVTIDSKSWSKMDGGDNSADANPMFPGGADPQVEMGGRPKRSPLVITRPWSDVLFAAYKALDNAVNADVTAVYQVLDGNFNAVPGETITYTGKLLATKRPGYDSEDSKAAMLEITVGTNGPIS